MNRSEKILSKLEAKFGGVVKDVSDFDKGIFAFQVEYPSGDKWEYPVSQATVVNFRESPPKNKGRFIVKIKKEAGDKAKKL